MIAGIALPGALRLAQALLLVILLPAGFVGLCMFALRQDGTARFAPFRFASLRFASLRFASLRFASLLNIFTAGLTFFLLVILALRHSPAVLAWCLAAAAVLMLVPLALNYAVRQRGSSASSPLPLLIQVAAVLFVPTFFLWLNFVEDTLHVSLPRIYIFPPR